MNQVFTGFFEASRKAIQRGLGTAVVLLAAQPLMRAESWQVEALRGLSAKYVEPAAAVEQEEYAAQLDRLVKAVGARLTSSGLSAIPAQDLALLSLLVSHQDRPSSASDASQSKSDQRNQARPEQEPQEPAQGQRKSQEEPIPKTQETLAEEPGKEELGEDAYTDISKGQEGFIQGVERLAQMPISERMTITGDITSGLQAATVTNAPTLTSTFGRARVNFVTRAVETTQESRFSDGYFFVQMVAAGGPFDASAVGGPSSFGPLNDVATDRSRFNEGTSRGNLYLAKGFYQQEMRLGEGSILARIGIIDLSDLFDTNDFANNEARQFLNSNFVNSSGYKAGIIAPGFMGEYRRRVRRDWLKGIVFRSGYAVSRTERAFTSPIWTGEVELQTNLRGYGGKYRFGGTVGNVADVGAVHGFHLSFDQWISRKIGVYGRYANSNSGPGSIALGPVEESYSAGVQWRFADPQDRISAWGFGFAQAFGIENADPLASERALETYYRWQLTDNFSLTPDFQLVFGSGGSKTQGTHFVGGVRMTFGF